MNYLVIKPTTSRVVVLWLSLLLISFTINALAQETRTERVLFKRGSSGTVINDQLKGYEVVDYQLNAAAGQHMSVVLATDNTSNYFTVTAPGATDALYDGTSSGDHFAATLPTSGDYILRVFLMRNAARRHETAHYSLTIDITGKPVAARPAQ